MRCFVEKGVAIIGSGEKSKKVDYNATDLYVLLKAICSCLETLADFEVATKPTYVDIFQEFWMILIFLGFQQELKWRTDWAPFIPIIARSSPVLVKERDKLQSPGSTFSQVVLSQSINPALRSHLGQLLPNSASLLRHITFAQCLWLMAIYSTEQHKLRLGFFDHLDVYLKSDVIELLGVYPLVEDLISTLIAQWKAEHVNDFDLLQVKLARQLMNNLCHIQPKTHPTSLKLLKNHFINEFSVYTDSKVWDVLANKLGTMFFVCRLELGSPELDKVVDDVTRDPTAAQSTFRDLVDLCRIIYGKAASETPNYFFKFAHTKIYSSSTIEISLGDRDVALLELLRVVFPTDRLDDKADMYLKTDTLLYRNAEDFVHYELQNLPVGDNIFAQVLELLLDFSCPAKVRKGIRQWLTLMDRNPAISIRMLSALSIKLPKLIEQGVKRDKVHPLRSKLTATPSLNIDRQEETNYIVCLAILLDFLSEQLQYDNICSPDSMMIYFDLVRRCLNSIRFLPSPQSTVNEELSLCRQLFQILQNECKLERTSMGKRRRATSASAFLVLLQGQIQDTQVWRGINSTGKPAYIPDSKRAILLGMNSISLELTRRLLEHFRITDFSNLEAWKTCHRALSSCSTLASFTVEKAIPISKESLIFSSPILLPTAISVFRSPELCKTPIMLNLAMRSLEQTQADVLFFYIPQLVQTLRHDTYGFIERSILHIAKQSPLFSHQIIWNMKANMYIDEAATQPDPIKTVLDEMVGKITKQLTGDAEAFYRREFAFFEKVTNISGALKSFVKKEKWEKKAKIDEELAKIAVDPGVYLPSNPEYEVADIDYDSGRPLQSHAKAPFMATFKVKPTNSDGPSSWQSAIFKVGDDCRQDVLALQLISLAKKLMEVHQLPVYLFPYRVVATAPGCGVIEVIPKSISRDQLGREKINSLYEYFAFRFGGESSRAFHEARVNFVKSMAAYSVVCYLLAIKDRHNGNIMIDDSGHLIHIDFGFILDIAPGGITFENAPFKLTSEMLQVMGGKEESPYFRWFCELCVQTFLVCRCYADSFVQLVEAMSESGLPCFKGDKTIRNLRNRFRLDLNSVEARDYMFDLVYKSCENVRTTFYDRYQLSTNGIPY